MIYALMLVLLLHFTKKLELFISNFKQCSEFSWDVLLQNSMWVEFAHSVSKNKYVQISKSTLSLKSQVLILDTYHVIKCFSSIDFWLLLMWHLNVVTLRCLIVYIGSTVIWRGRMLEGVGGFFFNVVVELLYIFIEIENVNSKSFNLWQSDSYPYLY